MSSTPLLERLALQGADADCGPADDGGGAGDAQRLIAAVRRAIDARDDATLEDVFFRAMDQSAPVAEAIDREAVATSSL